MTEMIERLVPAATAVATFSAGIGAFFAQSTTSIDNTTHIALPLVITLCVAVAGGTAGVMRWLAAKANKERSIAEEIKWLTKTMIALVRIMRTRPCVQGDGHCDLTYSHARDASLEGLLNELESRESAAK